MTRDTSAVGKVVFDRFENSVRGAIFEESEKAQRIHEAASLVEEMPLVTMPLRERGILGADEGNTGIIHVFRPNLWAQDYAYEVGKLHEMDITSSGLRAKANVEYNIGTSISLAERLRKRGRTEYDFYNAMHEAAMIESAYYTRLGGEELPEIERKKIDTGIARRTIRGNYDFRKILIDAGVALDDGSAILQFAEEIDLTEALQQIVQTDPYFKRRHGQISEFTKINSEKSVKLGQVETPKFVEELLVRIGKKHPALFKKIGASLEPEVPHRKQRQSTGFTTQLTKPRRWFEPEIKLALRNP